MTDKRKADVSAKTWYRSERFMQHNGKWFFQTREGTTEGPFGSRMDAALRLESYLGIRQSGMLSTEAELELAILPNE